MHPAWPRSIRDQCVAAGVPFFFKQWGEYRQGYRQGPLSAAWNNIAIYADGSPVYDKNFGKLRESLDGAVLLARFGKKAAGRLLDGREWSEFPSVRP